jgi:hypothetical protein
MRKLNSVQAGLPRAAIGVPELRLLGVTTFLLGAYGLAACSPQLALPVGSVTDSPAVSDAADYTADELSPREYARIYPMAHSRPSRVLQPKIAQTLPVKLPRQPSPEPEATGAVDSRIDPIFDPDNQAGRVATEARYRGWDAVARRTVHHVCTGC